MLAIEPVMGITDNLAPLITFSPALPAGEKITTVESPSEGPGLEPCSLQKDNVRTVPAFAKKPVLFVVSPESRPQFTGRVHCSVHVLNQLGATAKLARLDQDYGIKGNGHFMNEELNNGEIAKKVFIPFLSSIK